MHCVLNVGGNWNNRSNAGLFYFNGNNSTSNSNSNIGDKLMGECKKSVIKESKKNSINLCERKGET